MGKSWSETVKAWWTLDEAAGKASADNPYSPLTEAQRQDTLPLLTLAFGWGFLITGLLTSDQFYFPVVIRAPTYAWGALVVLAAGLASALVVRRRIDRLDMVAALKTRE